MNISQSIKDAWAAVEESGIPEHMQELAFREALRSSLAPSGHPAVPNGRPHTEAAGRANTERPGDEMIVNESTVMAAVSEHTSVPVEKLEKVFHLDDGVIKILINHSALGSSAADKTRATAQIITVVRKIGMEAMDTPFDIIRDECNRKHFYDSKNFASSHLPNIDGFAVKGDGRHKRLEARSPGIAAFPSLIDRVLGEA